MQSGITAGVDTGEGFEVHRDVERHATYHGVALNVRMDLEPFSRINPCGYAGLQTVDLSTIGVQTTWNEAAAVLSKKLVAALTP